MLAWLGPSHHVLAPLSPAPLFLSAVNDIREHLMLALVPFNIVSVTDVVETGCALCLAPYLFDGIASVNFIRVHPTTLAVRKALRQKRIFKPSCGA